jgi:hypothetical protein
LVALGLLDIPCLPGSVPVVNVNRGLPSDNTILAFLKDYRVGATRVARAEQGQSPPVAPLAVFMDVARVIDRAGAGTVANWTEIRQSGTGVPTSWRMQRTFSALWRKQICARADQPPFFALVALTSDEAVATAIDTM